MILRFGHQKQVHSSHCVARRSSKGSKRAEMADTNDGKAEFQERLRRYEERMHPQYSLQFDGAKLSLQENGKPIMSWRAVSGRPGTQGPEYQSYRDHVPMP